MRGDVDLAIDSYASMKSNLEDGKLRALGTSGEKRSLVLPNVPTVAEAGLPGYDVTSWNAFFVPAGTPQNVIDILNKATLEVLAIPETKKQMLDLGIEAKGSTPAELGKKLNDDITKWSSIITKANIEKQ
jgi:tripartite-type tricarboxylate transporter receptor subunit TctC